MKNFKKALALVLAAATAFTFAPVANLGTAVTAKAAGADQHYDLQQNDFDQTKVDAHSFNNTTTTGATTSIYFDGLEMQRDVTLVGGHKYQVSGLTNFANLKVNNSTTVLSSITKTGANSTYVNGTQFTVNGNGDQILNLEFLLTSPAGGSVTFVDLTEASGQSFDNITFSVNNPANINYSNTTGEVAIFEYDSKVDTDNNGTADGAWVEAPHTNVNSTGKQYTLQLNNNTKNRYALGVKANHANVTSWTNKTGTLEAVTASSTSKNLEWAAPTDAAGIYANLTKSDGTANAYVIDKATGRLESTPSYQIASTCTDAQIDASNSYNYSTNGYDRFKVTTAIGNKSSIVVNFAVKATGTSTSDGTDKTASKEVSVDYVTERSENAIDWIKWKGDPADYQFGLTSFTNSASDKNVATLNSNEGTENKGKIIMDQKINTDATLIVKSESQNIEFISSDPTIVSVTKDSEKYYKAKVQAKKAGTATIMVTVGGTNNNKGKVYNIPVDVSVNSIDKITVKDALDKFGDETDNTLYMDSADQTAVGAVLQDVFTFTSKGGLNISSVKSADTSVVDVTGSGNTWTVKSVAKVAKNDAPKSTTITVKTDDNVAANILGGETRITVVVWGKAAAPLDVDDVYLNLSNASEKTKQLTTKQGYSNVVWSIVNNGEGDDLDETSHQIFSLTNTAGAGNTQTTATIIGESAGKGVVKALVTESADYRPTARKVNVYVGANAADSNIITVSKPALVIEEGKEDTSLTVSSSAKKEVKVVSDNEAVATVASAGGIITVKGVKEGTANLTVSSEGATSITVPVVVTAKSAAADTAKKPAKITGVKVKNLTGGFVKVSWTKQNQKNIKYYVKKTVNGKSAGKSVNGKNTTLKVKKGATVKVKVKAYVYNANGKKLVGTYSKTVTKKTDKK